MLTIKTYRNTDTNETTQAHAVGTDESGRPLYTVPEGWVPEQPYGLNEDGLAYALDLQTFATAVESADTDREPLGLQTSSQLAWNVIRQWAEGDGPHHVQDGTYYVTTTDGALWRVVVDQGRVTIERQ